MLISGEVQEAIVKAGNIHRNTATKTQTHLIYHHLRLQSDTGGFYSHYIASASMGRQSMPRPLNTAVGPKH